MHFGYNNYLLIIRQFWTKPVETTFNFLCTKFAYHCEKTPLPKRLIAQSKRQLPHSLLILCHDKLLKVATRLFATFNCRRGIFYLSFWRSFCFDGFFESKLYTFYRISMQKQLRRSRDCGPTIPVQSSN